MPLKSIHELKVVDRYRMYNFQEGHARSLYFSTFLSFLLWEAALMCSPTLHAYVVWEVVLPLYFSTLYISWEVTE